MIYSSVETKGSIPYLTVNGERIDANAYITYFPKKAMYKEFADKGYRLYSVPLFFSSQTINESSDVPPFGKGIFDIKENPDFSAIDEEIQRILSACPDAYIFPRVNMSIPRWWEEENPDELNDMGKFIPEKKRACFSSDKWYEDTKHMLGQFIDHVEASDYRDSICGYQLACGNTEEWFSFDFLGSIGKRSREKFAEYIKENSLEGTEHEYYRYLSEIVATRICDFSAFAKEKTGNRLVIGAFYGYNLERPDRESCHNALEKVLNCGDVDFICSPVSYSNERRGGIDHPCMLAVESLKKHGKLYFVENDSRTHLTMPLFDHPHFQRPVFMARDKQLAIENIKLHYARALIHGHALWWFDMGGGWYADDCYMSLMESFLKTTKEAADKDLSSVSEVAVIIDPDMLNSIHMGDKNYNTVYGVRRQLGLMGTPYDCYISCDFDDIKDKYKAFILLCPIMTDTAKKIIDENKNVLTITNENSGIAPQELRSFCRHNGVHIYTEKDAVIFANKSYLFIHTAEEGVHKLTMPDGKKLKQIIGEKADPACDVLKMHCGYLYEVL